MYAPFQKRWPELQIEKERTFNIEAKLYAHPVTATVERSCENIQNYRIKNREYSIKRI